MPTSKLKNILYQCALPFLAPGPDAHCLIRTDGRKITRPEAYRRILRKHHVLGSVMLLSDGDQEAVLYSRSLSPDHNPLISPVFRVASITKMATALMSLICVDRGLISLDSPVVSVLPADFGSSDELRNVTLRQLLSHTAGIQDPVDLEQSLVQQRSILDVIRGCRFAEPGMEFRYSNLGFGLIGCILEAVLHEPVTDAFSRYLFAPLHSNATLDPCTLQTDRIMPVTRILPYHPGRDVRITDLGKRKLEHPDPYLHYGHTAGSMYTDVESLHRLMKCLMRNGEPLIKSELGLEMTKVHAAYGAVSPALSYGLGMLRIDDASISDSPVWGHQGYAYGCADGAFWEEKSGNLLIFLNGGCSEARHGRLGLCNRDLLLFAFRKEIPSWKQ